MPVIFKAEFSTLATAAVVNGTLPSASNLLPKPSITGITRLETHPTTIGLQQGLQAGVADPLWLLSRQWQFNEFQGEDAGTPLSVAFSVRGRPVRHFRPGDNKQPWQALPPGGAPLEARVEAERVWQHHPRLRGEAGLQLLRRADPALRQALLQAYPLALPAPADPAADPAGLLWAGVLHGRTVDAQALAAALAPLRATGGRLGALPAPLAALDATARPVLERWLAWLDGLVFEGAADNPAWQRDRLEYSFALGADGVALEATEYTDGHVDWEEFRAQPMAYSGTSATSAQNGFSVARRHPTPVRYPGMPADRYWEFEDGRVSFAGAEAGATDLLRLSVTEFALTFGNDWFLVPVRLPVGALYQVESFTVVDTFGVRTPVQAVADTPEAPWRMFTPAHQPPMQPLPQGTLFLPDSLDGVLEGAPLEHTLLVRDEMANLAWAIEKKVQGTSGEPLDRDQEAKGLAFQQQVDLAASDPQVVYRLATPVPANWTPLLPVRSDGLHSGPPLDIALERAGMKRFYPAPAALATPDPAFENFLDTLDAQPSFISPLPIATDLHVRAYVFHPRGQLLRQDPTRPMPTSDRQWLQEEEVPRIGASLQRRFQYARSADGRSWLWVGRSKTAGRGEASSQLRFDIAAKAGTRQ